MCAAYGLLPTVTDSSSVHHSEFANLLEPLLRRALDTLVKQGKAQVFEGSEGLEGVKFS